MRSHVARRIDGAWLPPALAVTAKEFALILAFASGTVHAGESQPAVVGQRTIAARPHPARSVATVDEPATAPPPPLDLSARVIKQAIADSRDPLDDVVVPRGAAFGATDPGGRRTVDQAFRQAEIPTCMTPEAYRFEPFGLGGLLGLPFLVHAIATGKCRH